MEENKQLGMAIGTPIAMLLAGVVGAAATTAQPTVATEVAKAEEQLDPETERILYPYRVAKRERILYPYRYAREKAAAKPKTELTAQAPAMKPSTTEVAVAGDIDPQLSVPAAPKMPSAPAITEVDLSLEPPTTEKPNALDMFLAMEDETSELAPSTTPELTPTPDATSPSSNDPATAAQPAATPPTTIASSEVRAQRSIQHPLLHQYRNLLLHPTHSPSSKSRQKRRAREFLQPWRRNRLIQNQHPRLLQPPPPRCPT